MTEADLRSLIDSYIVDNQGQGITPAKFRSILQSMVDYFDGSLTATYDGVGETDYTLYDSLGNPSINWDARQQFYSDGITVANDYNRGRLFDSSGNTSVLYDDHLLTDTNSNWSVNYSSYKLGFNFHATLDWYTCQEVDLAGNNSFDWNNRFAIYPDGVTTSIDYGNGLQYDNTGILSIDYNNRYLYNSAGVVIAELAHSWLLSGGTPVVDWYNMQLNDSTWSIRYAWNTGILYDASAVVSIDTANRLERNHLGAPMHNYDAGILYGSEGGESIVYPNRQMLDHYGDLSISWDLYQLSVGSHPTVDWSGNYLYKTSTTIKTVDWGNGILYNSAGTAQSVNWFNHALINPSNIIVVDYSNSILYDTGGKSSVQWQARLILDNTATTAIDYQNRILAASNGTTNINFSTPGAPTAPTQTAGDNSTKIATTAYADNAANRTVFSCDKVGITGTDINQPNPAGTNTLGIVGYVNFTAVTGAPVLNFQITWRDENDVEQVINFTVNPAGSAQQIALPYYCIRQAFDGAHPMSIALIGPTGGTCTFNYGIRVMKL